VLGLSGYDAGEPGSPPPVSQPEGVITALKIMAGKEGEGGKGRRKGKMGKAGRSLHVQNLSKFFFPWSLPRSKSFGFFFRGGQNLLIIFRVTHFFF
jgi:hypothetical protein